MSSKSQLVSPVLEKSPSREILERFTAERKWTERLIEPLSAEDCVIQSMPDVSPIRWHIAHTTWFFETFVLRESIPGYKSFHPAFEVLFNSYYNAVGEQFPRSSRGVLSRPTVREILEYRHHVDGSVQELLESGSLENRQEILSRIELGIQHEQQHQELMLADIKHVFSCNPLYPAYQEVEQDSTSISTSPEMTWFSYKGGLKWIGHRGEGFSYDNELPRHRKFVEDFQLAGRLVTNREFLDFIEDGGYSRSELWLSAGWDRSRSEGSRSPLYWRHAQDNWFEFTLGGLQPLSLDQPVCHVSYFEADAYARWSGARLPSEEQWEVAAGDLPVKGNLAQQGHYHPKSARGKFEEPHQLFGDVWEWTSSSYSSYPGYQSAEGALGEYNGKFMCNQYVLRGGSCATSRFHIRKTYRNFFPPEARWQFTGIRLAR